MGITELRRHFGRILDEVEKGRTFVITRRGREVALLVSVETHRAVSPGA
ncbi:type II toxin-antitoxin system Phd/YefM family antitoxin [Mycolicibacterium austroafricanum]|nr:type II toxin-antitoxin system Phd/YefM family antitoxin [Mycolicibacterium austroafricanum]QZY47079.1 type II toxin-antitoxin system Phd/YefM family antitoxin [Mycolicibacterium austroafricanum]